MVIDDTFYMSLALKEAWKYQGLTYPNPPVGALILDKNNQIIAIEAHHKAGLPHAELKAIESALIKMGDTKIQTLHTPNEKHAYILAYHDKRLEGCSIYVTLEPCNHQGSTPPCSLLIKNLRFKKLICGSIDPNQDATGGIKMIQEGGIAVTVGLLKEECDALIAPFKKWQESKPFVFFKLALSANGVYDGGIISSLTSRTLVHQMRDTIDFLVIGGNTVREDRPTLDSRLIDGKAPDILIISNKKEFDQSIPLFSVPGRKVFIEDNFDRIKQYHFIMIEGTQSMLELSEPLVDWYCIFTSSSYKKGKTIQLVKDFRRLQLIENKHDTISWYKGI